MTALNAKFFFCSVIHFYVRLEHDIASGVQQTKSQERIASLQLAQADKQEMAELIELNSDLVDKALLVIRSAIAAQVSFFILSHMII